MKETLKITLLLLKLNSFKKLKQNLMVQKLLLIQRLKNLKISLNKKIFILVILILSLKSRLMKLWLINKLIQIQNIMILKNLIFMFLDLIKENIQLLRNYNKFTNVQSQITLLQMKKFANLKFKIKNILKLYIHKCIHNIIQKNIKVELACRS